MGAGPEGSGSPALKPVQIFGSRPSPRPGRSKLSSDSIPWNGPTGTPRYVALSFDLVIHLWVDPGERGPFAMTDNQALTPLQRQWSLAAVISSAFAFGLTFGLSGPMIALILEENGVSSTLIGLNSAVASLAVLVIGPVIPRILDRIGPLPTMYFSVAGSVLMFLLFPWWTNVSSWFVLRFLLGGFGALHWIVSEIWIVSIVDKANRGKVVGLYVTVVSAGFAVGPLLINLVGVEGWLPFLLAAALIS